MVAPWKKKEVDLLAKKMGDTKVVGLVGISNIPSRQFQQIRRNLRGDVELRVCRSNVIRHALKKADREQLSEHMQGSVGIVFTELNPFKLEKKIFDNKIKGPAKAGSAAPHDIIIPKGDTPFAPGPIIGDLQKVGIKAKIAGGKIVVTQDSLVAKEGEVISRDLANVLSRMGITPSTIGLELIAAYDEGIVYPGSVLHVDEAETIAGIQSAHTRAINLAYNAGIYNSETVTHFIAKAASDARNLAYNAEIVNKETVGFFLSKASAQMRALKSVLPPKVLADAKEETKEEEPAGEEKKEGVVQTKESEAKHDGGSVKESKKETENTGENKEEPAPAEAA